MSETIAAGMGLMLLLALLCAGAFQWGYQLAWSQARKIRHLGVELDKWHHYIEPEPEQERPSKVVGGRFQ